MLFMLPARMKKVPLDRIYPYNENYLFVAVSEKLAFALIDIKNDEGVLFSIKGIMDNDPKVFGTTPFRERMDSFTNIIHSKLERFFITGKDEYLFFDSVEQEKLKALFKQHALTAKVDIYRIKDHRFELINLDQITMAEFAELRPPIKALGAVFLSPPEHFMNMLFKCREFDKTMRAKRPRPSRLDPRTTKLMSKYPELKSVRTKSDFTTFYRSKSKELHPDLHPESAGLFQEFQQDITVLKKSKWFKSIV